AVEKSLVGRAYRAEIHHLGEQHRRCPSQLGSSRLKGVEVRHPSGWIVLPFDEDIARGGQQVAWSPRRHPVRELRGHAQEDGSRGVALVRSLCSKSEELSSIRFVEFPDLNHRVEE